jgi:hypothetical protein
MNLAEDAAAELLAVGRHIADRNGIDLTDIEAHQLAVAAAVDSYITEHEDEFVETDNAKTVFKFNE